MATSGTIRNDFRTGYAVQLVWNVTSQSIADNTSTVRVRVQLVSTGSSYTINSSATKNGSVTINGTTYKFTFSAALSGSETKTIVDKPVTVSHGSNGAKTCSFSFSASINVTLSGTYYGTISKSGSGVFNTIPRASAFDSVSAASSYINSAITYKYTPKSSSFYNRLVVKAGSSTLTTVNLGAKAASQQTGTLTLSSSQLSTVYSMYPKAVSAILIFTVETYSNSDYTTKVGTSAERKLTLTFPTSLVPAISSVTLTEAEAGIAAKFGGYVQNKSKVKVAVSAAGVSGSTISSVKTAVDGKTYTGATITSGILSKSGSVSVSITVTDSRGRTASASRTITVLAYTPPQIGAFKAYRSLADGTENYEGQNLYISFNYTIAAVSNKNDSSYKIEYRKSGTTAWTELYTGTSYTLASSYITDAKFSVDNAYEVRMTVSDYFTTDSSTVDIPTAFTLMDLKANGRGIAIGKVAEKDGFEVGIPAYFSYGEVPSSAVVLNPDEDLDNIKTSGFYTFSSATRTTLLNIPIDTGSGAVIVLDMGEAGQKMQIAVKCSVNSEIWERMYYSSTWYAWKKVYNGKGKILWSGSYYMTENQTATLSEKVSEQSSGIVLVFSRYVDGAAQNYGINSFFVSKMLVSEQEGKGNVFTLNSSAIFGVLAAKYLYLHDDKITGNAENNASGTASSGITYNNAGFVLRYVIGV